jgi:hypothetical protein
LTTGVRHLALALLDLPPIAGNITLMDARPANRPNRYIEPLNPQQIRIYRRMTGEQRLLLSLDMIRSVWRIAAGAIRNQNPGIPDEGLKLKLKERRR